MRDNLYQNLFSEMLGGAIHGRMREDHSFLVREGPQVDGLKCSKSKKSGALENCGAQRVTGVKVTEVVGLSPKGTCKPV